MDDSQMEARIRELYAEGDMAAFAKAQLDMTADDFVQEWPQSGERIRGLDNVAKLNEGYEAGSGTTPQMTLRRILKPGDAWVIEGTIDYGDGIPVSAVAIFEFDAEGKLRRETDYFANPFEPPAWRSHLVELMEPEPAVTG